MRRANKKTQDTILTFVQHYQNNKALAERQKNQSEDLIEQFIDLEALERKIINYVNQHPDERLLTTKYSYSLNGDRTQNQKYANIVHYCVDHGLTEVLELFFKHPPDIEEINSVCLSDGTTPLANACSNGDKEIVALLLRACPKDQIKTLINQRNLKISSDDPDSNEIWVANSHPMQTPLIYALLAGHIEIVKLLLDNDANAHTKDHLGNRAFDYARGNLEMKKLIASKSGCLNYFEVKYHEFKIYLGYESTKIAPYNDDNNNTYMAQEMLDIETSNRGLLGEI